MTTELITDPRASAPPQRKVSLVAKMAERFSVEPGKLMGTLKATAFKTAKDSPPATDEQLMALLIVADQYSLNPFTKEIFAFPDKGGIVPVVSVDGWARIVNDHPAFDGVQFDIAPDGSACTCTMYRKDRAHPTVITEYLAECKRGSPPWQSHPRRMLRHKALIQCARIAFGFAGIYDEDEAQRIVSPRDMGPADEVREPVSTAAHAVRTLIQGEEVAPPVPAPTPDAFEAFSARLTASSDPEIAALVIDEARALPDDDYQTLLTQYRAKFNPPQEAEA